MEITIAQLKMNKKGLESTINTLIDNFEKVNGVSIIGISLDTICVSNVLDRPKFIGRVTTTIKI